MKYVAIAAVGKNGVIGDSNTNSLVWTDKRDMERFKMLTMGNVVVMGRKTWESIPERYRPLPGRYNIVISSNPNYHIGDGVVVVNSVESAMSYANRYIGDLKCVYFIGGGMVYRNCLKYCDSVLLTEVDRNFEGDVYFPLNDLKRNFEVSGVMKNEGFSFVNYVRIYSK